MILFHIGVLTSVTFWLLYAVVGMFFAMGFIKVACPNVFKYIKKGEIDGEDMGFTSILFIFWPIVAACVIIRYACIFLFQICLAKGMKYAMMGVANCIPNFKIVKENK